MQIDFDHWKGAQIGDTIMTMLNEQQALQVITALKPEFSRDGNQWCYLYGTLPNDYIVGFGDTPAKAMHDFYNSFLSTKAAAPKSEHNIQTLTGTSEIEIIGTIHDKEGGDAK